MNKFLDPLHRAYCKLLEICFSRKFLVLFISSYLLHSHLLSGTEFLPIALAVLGIQGFLDSKNPRKGFHEAEESENLPGV